MSDEVRYETESEQHYEGGACASGMRPLRDSRLFRLLLAFDLPLLPLQLFHVAAWMALLAAFTGIPKGIKLLLVLVSFSFGLLDLISGWLIRFLSADFAYLKIASFIIFYYLSRIFFLAARYFFLLAKGL